MDEMIYYDSAREKVTNFFLEEFPSFPPLILSNFLNRFNDFLNYSEEGKVIRPNFIFTNSIETVAKSLPKTNVLTIFEDKDATQFNSRIKSIIAVAERNWPMFIDIKEGKISYGLILSFGSIKDRRVISTLLNNTTLKDRPVKINCIIARPLNFYTMALNSITGRHLEVNFSLDTSKVTTFDTEIAEFVDAVFSKLRTTQRKLQDMKNMYRNIFTNVLNDVNGAICVIVDKDYVDTGLFSDGIWLSEPISFSKLFNQTKSYSEEKLQTYANLFINMLNFDGITIIDNKGQIRAYNVFVEPNSKRVGYIVGGARKRAAYYILSGKRKGIVGVYFQSHEGEVFFQQVVPKTKKNKKKDEKPENKKAETFTLEGQRQLTAKQLGEKTTESKAGAMSNEKVASSTTENEKDKALEANPLQGLGEQLEFKVSGEDVVIDKLTSDAVAEEISNLEQEQIGAKISASSTNKISLDATAVSAVSPQASATSTLTSEIK